MTLDDISVNDILVLCTHVEENFPKRICGIQL